MQHVDDLQNQAALRLARDADPDGERTIGVLTKPDALTKGAVGNRQKWRDVIEGKSHPLKHGYYCVRLPDDDERKRNLSRAESQKIAADFFEAIAPWNAIADRNRFGVPNFVANISELLVKLIEKNLTKLKEKVQQLLDDCEAQLRLLPVLTMGEPMTEVCSRITQFCADFQSAVFGESHKLELVQPNKRRYNGLKDEIFRTRPNFTTSLIIRDADYVKETSPQPAGPVIDLNHVKQAIADSVGWELPTHVPYDATKNFIRGFTSQWDGLALSCFNDIFATTSDFVQECVRKHFGQFKSFETQVAAIVQHDLDQCRDGTQHTLNDLLLKLEQVPFHTQNTEFFRSQWQFWCQYYHGRSGHHWCNFERTHNDEAIQVMAVVRAYFEVAYKRVIDYVPLTIEHELNQTLAAHFQDSLLNRFLGKMGTPDQMKALLTEDPSLAKKREFLEDRRTRLQQIKRRLEEVRKDVVNGVDDASVEHQSY
ncbi:hypothetical protein DXG03_008696 [Asterophora parasitica]|uniref:GED domain-containing protein n=1 Tax=Asterophora parasitica TaxID=117018 RepID=A0A9P7G067_9AGAR|nr:hypothetical protein DXG03_008696 [Asterophora parasitica]